MSLINLKQLQLFFSAVGQKVKSSRGNWNQNDPTADDYIKNRPFYEDENGIHKIDEKYLPDSALILKSSTEGSTKRFKITVDDAGTITATETD